jgi:GDP-L-fucose synthase
MNLDSKILVLGHKGLVGSAIIQELEKQGYKNIITAGREWDLTESPLVNTVFAEKEPEYVFLAAAKVGGIGLNDTKSAEMIHNNLMIQTNVINAAHTHGVKKLMFLGSSCIYPKYCPQPIKEEYLLTGELEQTNIGYSAAKIAGIVMCNMYRKQYGSNFISAMPTNLYGPGDNFHLENSHVMPAIIRKLHDAKERGDKMVELWGSGTPMREFLYIEDLAKALIFLMNNYDGAEIINVGTGKDVSIEELAHTIKDVIGFKGSIVWDASKPDGTPKKLLDVSKLNNLGWKSETSLENGIKQTYDWFKNNYKNSRL